MLHLVESFTQRAMALIGLDEISISRLPKDAALRMRRQQIRGAIEQMRIFVIGNTLFAPVLAFQAWNTGINGLVVCWTTAMLAFSWWLFYSWRSAYQTDGDAADMDSFVRWTQVNASLWCMGMILFYPMVEGDGKTILTTVMAGSLALGTVGFAQAPRAAFWFLGIQTAVLTLVPIFTGVITGSQADIMIGFLALVAGTAIFNAALERGKAQMRAFMTHEQLSQKTEVIDLLLKDYEEQGVEWLWQTDAEGCLTFGPQQVLDLMAIHLGGAGPVNLTSAIEQTMDPRGQRDLKRLKMALVARNDFHDVTLPFHNPDGNGPKWIMMRGRPQYNGTDFIGFRGIFADATTTVEAQRKIEFLADHDPLTGIANRNVVKRKLATLHADAHHVIALLIDLDGFKQVNDSYGHAIGDRLLEAVAKRLTAEVREDDLVARLGGDEFLILVDVTEGDTALDQDDLVARLLATLSRPYSIAQYDIVLSASIGKASFPKDTRVGPTLLIQADLALYDAKQNGRNQCSTFVGQMQAGMQKRLVVMERLKAAIGSDAITPFYQPQFCAQTGTLVGFEALARWHDASLGAVGPDIFIPIAEETGLIHDLGEKLLFKACQEAMTWPKVAGAPPLLLSVNLSPAQVTRGDVVSLVQQVLRKTKLPPTQLEIEITEGVLIHDMQATCEVLRDLSFLGVKIALDDFGTGYSSLSYIRALPLDRLKIDRAFVADLDDPTARPIVQTIIDLCSTLNLSVIAEGVETEAQLDTLKGMRCDVLQGYYFAPALPADQTRTLIAEHFGRDEARLRGAMSSQ